MPDYSSSWRSYLEVEEGELEKNAEVLARFHTHVRRIPGQEEVSGKDLDGKFGDVDLLYSGYHLEEFDEDYRDFVERIRQEEDFVYEETADLFVVLGEELEDLHRVREILGGVESGGTTARNLRRLGELMEEALERKI
jgi:hypothetical protein